MTPGSSSPPGQSQTGLYPPPLLRIAGMDDTTPTQSIVAS